MATIVPFDLEEADLGEGLSLIVVERGDDELTDAEIKIASDARSYLEDAWATTLEILDSRELVPYSPEVVIRAEDDRALVINDDLREENEIIDALLQDADRAQIGPGEVSAENLYLYAVVSDTDAGRVAMVKKTSPTKRARGGKRWALAGDELALMSDDPWQLHPAFDLVVTEDGGFALNTWFFEQLFADAERLVAEVDSWVGAITEALPLASGDDQVLADLCRTSARLRRRLRSIVHRGHIERVELPAVRRHVKEMGLEPAHYIRNGELFVDETNASEMLQILNEDLMRGGLTQDPFRVEAKEPL